MTEPVILRMHMREMIFDEYAQLDVDQNDGFVTIGVDEIERINFLITSINKLPGVHSMRSDFEVKLTEGAAGLSDEKNDLWWDQDEYTLWQVNDSNPAKEDFIKISGSCVVILEGGRFYFSVIVDHNHFFQEFESEVFTLDDIKKAIGVIE